MRIPCSRLKLVNLYYPENYNPIRSWPNKGILSFAKKKSYCAFCCPSLKRYLYN